MKLKHPCAGDASLLAKPTTTGASAVFKFVSVLAAISMNATISGDEWNPRPTARASPTQTSGPNVRHHQTVSTIIRRYIYTYIHVYIYMYTVRQVDRWYIYTCINCVAHRYTYMHTCMHTHVRTYTHTHIYIHTHGCVYAVVVPYSCDKGRFYLFASPPSKAHEIPCLKVIFLWITKYIYSYEYSS